MTRPTDELAAAEAAFAMLLAATASLTDEQVRGPSRLPGWTRGHVLTHLARSGEGDASTIEGAAVDEVRAKYPGGNDQREEGIQAGAQRSPAELRADLVETQRRLTAAWDALPDAGWTRLNRFPGGTRTARDVVPARRREVLVHLVDLDVGVGPVDLPADYLAGDQAWLREYRTRETWPDAPW